MPNNDFGGIQDRVSERSDGASWAASLSTIASKWLSPSLKPQTAEIAEPESDADQHLGIVLRRFGLRSDSDAPFSSDKTAKSIAYFVNKIQSEQAEQTKRQKELDASRQSTISWAYEGIKSTIKAAPFIAATAALTGATGDFTGPFQTYGKLAGDIVLGTVMSYADDTASRFAGKSTIEPFRKMWSVAA